MIKKYENLFITINYRFNNEDLLDEAFTHNSMAKKHRTYQRLEFLGDRVLGLTVADMLYHTFELEQEGDLAKRHASLVKEETLAEVAREIGLADYLIISESEKSNLDNPSMLADSCEALIGALYIESGFQTARDFIKKFWTKKMNSQSLPPIDGKSFLQEWAQSKGYNLPVYKVLEITGCDHAPEFRVEVHIGNLLKKGVGIGKSKKNAEQNAANDLLRKINE